jgi:hypothetical protein
VRLPENVLLLSILKFSVLRPDLAQFGSKSFWGSDAAP